MNRCRAGSMARSWAETAYHDGSACQAAGPGWSDEEAQARGELLGCDLGAQLRIQVLGEVLGEELRVDDGDGERRGEHQMVQKRPRRVADAQAGDRLTAVWDVRRRVDQSADVCSAAGGVGDHEPAVGVSHQDLVSRDRVQRRLHDRHVGRHRSQAERRGRRLVAVLVQRVGHPVPSGRRCEGAVHEHDRRFRLRRSALALVEKARARASRRPR